MNIQTYIQQVGLEVAAKTLGVSVPAIKHYRNGIRRISPTSVIATCAATGWKVTPHEARPDIYPNPSDGLPAEQLAEKFPSTLNAIKPSPKGLFTPFTGGGYIYSNQELDRRLEERRQKERREQDRRNQDRRSQS